MNYAQPLECEAALEREKERERNDNKLLVTLRAVAAFERSRS